MIKYLALTWAMYAGLTCTEMALRKQPRGVKFLCYVGSGTRCSHSGIMEVINPKTGLPRDPYPKESRRRTKDPTILLVEKK